MKFSEKRTCTLSVVSVSVSDLNGQRTALKPSHTLHTAYHLRPIKKWAYGFCKTQHSEISFKFI